MKYCLGIDTSNYTTSLAAAPVGGGEVVFARKMLTVTASLGLRQSEAHFQHTQNLPELFSQLKGQLPPGAQIARVAVSARPRPQEGSYMPCFVAGVSAAHAAAFSAGCEVMESTHQEGHIAAALYGCPAFPDVERFYCMHLSGGTLEAALIEHYAGGYHSTVVAQTHDITLGKLLDRTAAALGVAFPGGAEVDRLALSADRASVRVKIPVRGDGINLSGFENKIRDLLSAGRPAEEVCHYAMSVAEASVLALLTLCPEPLPMLLCGGVSASAFLRERLSGRVYFTEPMLATDNAAGLALLGAGREGYRCRKSQ